MKFLNSRIARYDIISQCFLAPKKDKPVWLRIFVSNCCAVVWKTCPLSQNRPDRPWGPPSLLTVVTGVIYKGKSDRVVKLTTHLHIAPRWGTGGTIPQLPSCIPLWCG